MANEADTWGEAPSDLGPLQMSVGNGERTEVEAGGVAEVSQSESNVVEGTFSPNSRELSLLSNTESIAELGIDRPVVQFPVDDFDSSERSWNWSSRYPSKRHNDGSFLRESYSR
jgi:hypothetical protein